jgi:hypothetical protein
MPEPLDHRAVAVATYNRSWDLLETENRTADEDAELLTVAFTSRHHWLAVGGAPQIITADWMVSRVASELGHAGLAVVFAQRAFDGVQHGDHPAWLRASIFEGLGRAYAVQGDEALRNEYVSMAWLVLEQEEDAENRAVIEQQLATVPVVSS